MRYDKCHNCGEWGRTDTHKCPPVWGVYLDDPNYGEDGAKRIYADSADEAACKSFARWESYWADGGGNELGVIVFLSLGPDTERRFTVRGGMVPRYAAEGKK
ncbi:MAG: hypothetical protein V3W44_02200 [Dehalococcoidales bacterium]